MQATIERLTTAARELLDAVHAHRDGLQFAFDDPRRAQWTYVPGVRHGVPIGALDRRGAKAVHGLLTATLSMHAHVQVAAIMGLEDPLGAHDGLDRQAGDYWVAIHGTPGEPAWSWRLGGHHVSVRATVVGNQLRPTPLFLGANPARVVHDGIVTSQPLAPEEHLAFQLLDALMGQARRDAILDRRAPSDIATGDAPFLDDLPAAAGVPLGMLGGEARRLGRRLVEVYLARLAPAVRRHYLDDLLPQMEGDLRFAWAGETRPPEQTRDRRGHYYRLVGPRFLAELDNTQNRANHVHSVWRDVDGDHGRDLT